VLPARGAGHLGFKLAMILGLLANTIPATGQTDAGYYARTSPYLPYTSPEPVKYNLKWGKLTARVSGTADSEFNDNVNLSETAPRSDFSLGINVGLGILYPFSEHNVLQIDLGAGYRWYLSSPSLNSFGLSPNTRLDQTIIIGDVHLNVHDNISIQTDPLGRPEIGGGISLINFQMFHNVAGLTAEWQPFRYVSFVGGYDYTLDRALTASFTALDLDTHTFNAGMNYIVSPRWTVGVGGAYSFTTYRLKIQNDNDTYTVGPTVTWHATKVISVNASVGYTVSSFDGSGTIADNSEFGSWTFQGGIKHTINPRMSHELRFGRSSNLGFGNNFTDTYTAQYSLRTQLTSAISLGTGLAYEHFRLSGAPGEQASRYLATIGTGFHLTRLWSIGLGYSYALKQSDQPAHGYSQNRLTLNVTRQF